jgi:hypothetical protein
LFSKAYNDRSIPAIEELDEAEATKKKGKYNLGGYIP